MAFAGTYDPAQVVVTFLGNILTGFGPDTFLTVERESDAFSDEVGADGEVARARSRDRRGTVTLTLLQSSLSNDVLSAAAAADELGGLGVGPLLIKDLTGATLVAAESAWVRKIANVEYGKEITAREWMIRCADMTVLVGGIAA